MKPLNVSDCVRVFPLADGRHLTLDGRTMLMGILNVTPDSFSDGGCWNDLDVGMIS